MRDTRLRSNLLKKYTYLTILGPFRSLSIRKSACVNTYFFSADNQSPREPKLVLDVYHIFRPPYCMVYHGGTPIWRFHTGLCKFLRNISTNICSLEKRTGLKLGQVSYFIDFYNITLS